MEDYWKASEDSQVCVDDEAVDEYVSCLVFSIWRAELPNTPDY